MPAEIIGQLEGLGGQEGLEGQEGHTSGADRVLFVVAEKPRFQVLLRKIPQSLPIDRVECSGG
jgi:hypothetical protein